MTDRRFFFLVALIAVLAACSDPEPEVGYPALDDAVLQAFSAVDLKETIDFLAADERAGRIPGSPGHLQARDWIAEQMETIGLEPLGSDGYLYDYDTVYDGARYMIDASGDVVSSVNATGYDLVGLIHSIEFYALAGIALAHAAFHIWRHLRLRDNALRIMAPKVLHRFL